MLGKLLKNMLIAALDTLAPTAPPPVAAPTPPLPEGKLDPKQVALEMRTLAGWLHAKADKLDPVVMPEFPLPPTDILPTRWNRVLDEDGESGGVVKRRNDPAPAVCKPVEVTGDDLVDNGV